MIPGKAANRDIPWRVLICRSNPIAPDPRVEKEARTLVQAGYQVTLLGWDRSAQLPTHDLLAGIPCFRLPIQAEFARGIYNFRGLARWQWGLLAWLVSHRNEYDIIHACDFDTLFPSILCKLLWGKRIVYDIFDFYADHLRATPQAIKNILRRVDLMAIAWTDAVIIVDEARYAQIQRAKIKRYTVIYNTPEDTKQADEPPSSHQDSLGLRLAYVGLLQVERGLFEMLEVLKKHPEWTLDLAGFGGDAQRVGEIARGMHNVYIHGRVSYELALQLSRRADVLFATYDPSILNHKYASPNKIFEAMMLGKPVIVARGTNMDQIVEKAGCGLVVTYGNVDELEAALTQIQNNPELRTRLAQNARVAYEITYSWDIMRTRLVSLYKQVTQSLS
jgi:glycosyltransferase involved in cell wall biosynthesis